MTRRSIIAAIAMLPLVAPCEAARYRTDKFRTWKTYQIPKVRYLRKLTGYEVHAFQMTLENRRDFDSWPRWLMAAYDDESSVRLVTWNDWVVREDDGEIHIHSPQKFDECFERVP